MLSRRLVSALSSAAALRRPLLKTRALASVAAATSSETIVFSSRHEPIEIPHTTIWEIAQSQAEAIGGRSAFICGLTHQPLTFAELCEGAKRVAVALAEDGVRKGDVSCRRCFNYGRSY